jgi:hypothetical protein
LKFKHYFVFGFGSKDVVAVIQRKHVKDSVWIRYDKRWWLTIKGSFIRAYGDMRFYYIDPEKLVMVAKKDLDYESKKHILEEFLPPLRVAKDATKT